ncbi:hypothetical protein GM51_4045 [freshwater metagenome]|uniref:DUF1800 domain-containing protein n=1 Tax=freshwater metagenome TaxID=449393 RepID=A0A094QFK7_9ZZZZ
MDTNRLEIARLFHRFGFGPRPGEFETAMVAGPVLTRDKLFNIIGEDQGLKNIPNLEITELGRRPSPDDPQRTSYGMELRRQNNELTTWWLDRMVLADFSLQEKATWFWHGHWATSIKKLNFALPMYVQHQTLQKYALGNFNEMVQAMLDDGALQFWLDGQENTAKSPNENLARELMELFTLGVGRYSENDVKELSRALTGIQVNRTNGEVSFRKNRFDNGVKSILGSSQNFDRYSAGKFLVAQPNCQLFIAERVWYRYLSSQYSLPKDSEIVRAFEGREIRALLLALASSDAMRDTKNEIVKSPVEWFVAVCRALSITPSKLTKNSALLNYLSKLAQVPFDPPNVGGWPTDDAWLSSASAQFRASFASWLIKQGDISPIANLAPVVRIQKTADLLGVVEWSSRTKTALEGNVKDPYRLILLAICSPEYLVNA